MQDGLYCNSNLQSLPKTHFVRYQDAAATLKCKSGVHINIVVN
jgi:hypothetical protein